MAYPDSGTLTTDKRTVDESETWDTQTDWEAYQSISAIEISNGVVMLTEIPGDESFEHNDLSGVYGGDTSGFEIQTSIVSDGTYALFGNTSQSFAAVSRDQTPWNRYGMRISFSLYTPSDAAGGGGIAFATAVSGHSSLDGYYFYADNNAGDGTRRISRVDAGSRTTLEIDSASLLTGDAWVDGYVEYLQNGTINFGLDGVELSAVDETYTQLLLGFFVYNEIYMDDIQFSLL